MSAAPKRELVIDADWNALSEAMPVAVPSWLAPPFESNSFPVVRSIDPASPTETDTEEVEEPVRPRLSLAPPRLPQLEEERRAPEPPAYPDLREENSALIAQVAALTAAVGSIRRAILSASEPEVVRLSCAIAERITRRELTTDPTMVIAWVREASETLATSDAITLVVAPDLGAAIGEDAFRSALSTLAAVEVDATLGSMKCEVRTRVSRVDASLEERLGAVAEDLGVGRL